MYVPSALAVVTLFAAQFSASIFLLNPRLSVCVPSGLRYLTRYLVSPLLVLYLVTFAIGQSSPILELKAWELFRMSRRWSGPVSRRLL